MKINELDKNAGVTQNQLDTLESVLDKVFSKVGIDVEFTRHFIDRVNDARNVKPISIKELGMLFKKEFVKYGKPIAQLGPDAEAVMKDLSSDINIPFVLNWNGEELELVAKTVMRKKDFKSSNKEFAVESDDIMVKGKQSDFPDNYDATDDTTFNDFSKKELNQIAMKAISSLNKQEQMVLKARFGLEPFKTSYPLQKIADAMNLTRERIRQIENKALRKLKHPSRSLKLRSFLNQSKDFTIETSTASLGSKINFPGMQNRTATPAASVKAVAPITKKPMAAPKNRFDKIVNWGKSLFNNIEKSLAYDESKLDEDLRSMPPLADLIVLAVVAQTTVAGLKTMLKTALKTGKGLRKIKKMADSAGVKINDTLNPDMYESAREDILKTVSSRQERDFYLAALSALNKLLNSKGSKGSVESYAFDIARSFNGMDYKTLVGFYNKEHSIDELQEATQSNPLVVLDKLADRSDNKEFPVKFYDDTVITVTPKKAKKFMDVYYRMADEQRDIIHKYIKTKKGFMQAINDFNIPM